MNIVKKTVLGILSLLGFLVFMSVPVSANVNNFQFEEFSVDYYLSKDSGNRAQLKVVEKLVALFPDHDQNKGFVRIIPTRYDGHSVKVKLDKITRNGQAEPIYDEERDWNNLTVSTGTEDYVRGRQVYEITYTLKDVVKDFGTHQEFYWDTNGTDWGQPFGRVLAQIHLKGELKQALNGQVSCYQGVEGSSSTCSYSLEDDKISFQSNGSLGPRQNVTMAVGFKQGSFALYERSLLVLVMIAIVVILTVATLVNGVAIFVKNGRSAEGRGTIVPEYLPPKNISVMMASGVNGLSAHVLAAQFIDLAVRHKVQIVEREKSGVFGQKKTYSIKLLNSDGMQEDEKSLLKQTTGLSLGGEFEFKQGNSTADTAVYKLMSQLPKKLLVSGYVRKIQIPKFFSRLIIVDLIVSTICFIVTIIAEDVLIAVPAAAVVLTVVLAIILYTSRPLTDTGVALRDYLKGMKMYIKVGEAERLKILQSPQGADKTPVKDMDGVSLVKLYEKMLPYAVLFGLEKQWFKVLELQYGNANASPVWYSGTNGFQAGALSSMVGGFSSGISSTMSQSSGAGGGGSSGGGGGGGGGGGR